MAPADQKNNKPRLLAYGVEAVGLPSCIKPVSKSLFDLEFENLNTSKKFQDYDGVILFQSTFEIIRLRRDPLESYWDIDCREDELARRRTQALQLREKGGFICFLLHRQFIDRNRYYNFEDTDLSKIYLAGLSRESLNRDLVVRRWYRSEFERFFKEYGIARTSFSIYSKDKRLRKLCEAGGEIVGLILYDSDYFVPCRLPKEDEISDFFENLAAALVSTSKKLRQEIPTWVEEYQFPPEVELLTAEEKLNKELQDLQKQKGVWRRFKRCLCYDGEMLVESVTEVLQDGLGLRLSDKDDEHIEDSVVLDDSGREVALLEIKGTNENVKSPNIYQADSHRGRRDKPIEFPSILIVNTFIKSSNKLGDKEREINSEQIRLAVNKRILVLRSMDLLNLLHLKEQGKLDKNKILRVFSDQCGWLKVSQEGYEVKTD